MTFVFRTSSFFVVFVITLKATTFVVGNTSGGPAGGNGNRAADRLNDHVERLIDEAVRFRADAREAADHVVDMAFALHVLGDRVIERGWETACAAIGRTRSVLRLVARFAWSSTSIAAFALLHDFRSAMPKKEVSHGGYIAA